MHSSIGVLTKLDRIEECDQEGKLKILLNELDGFELDLGWTGIVNQNQQDLNDEKDMDYIDRKERDFLLGNKHFRDLPNTGAAYLEKRCSDLLTQQVIDFLPGFVAELEGEKAKRKDAYLRMKMEQKNMKNLGTLLNTITRKISSIFDLAIFGDSDRYTNSLSSSIKKKCLDIKADYRAEIEKFDNQINQNLATFQSEREKLKKELSEIVEQNSGVFDELFPKDKAAQELHKRTLPPIIKKPMNDLGKEISRILDKMITYAVDETVVNFPALKKLLLRTFKRNLLLFKAKFTEDTIAFIEKHRKFVQRDMIKNFKNNADQKLPLFQLRQVYESDDNQNYDIILKAGCYENHGQMLPCLFCKEIENKEDDEGEHNDDGNENSEPEEKVPKMAVTVTSEKILFYHHVSGNWVTLENSEHDKCTEVRGHFVNQKPTTRPDCFYLQGQNNTKKDIWWGRTTVLVY